MNTEIIIAITIIGVLISTLLVLFISEKVKSKK